MAQYPPKQRDYRSPASVLNTLPRPYPFITRKSYTKYEWWTTDMAYEIRVMHPKFFAKYGWWIVYEIRVISPEDCIQYSGDRLKYPIIHTPHPMAKKKTLATIFEDFKFEPPPCPKCNSFEKVVKKIRYLQVGLKFVYSQFIATWQQVPIMPWVNITLLAISAPLDTPK